MPNRSAGQGCRLRLRLSCRPREEFAMALHAILLKLQSLFRRRRMASEINEELEFHQALLRDRLSRQGVPPAELDMAARRTFGNASRWRASLTEVWRIGAIELPLRDVTFSARLLPKLTGFTA